MKVKARKSVKPGKYVHEPKPGVLVLFDTRSKIGRAMRIATGKARDLVLPDHRDVIKKCLQYGEYVHV